MNKEDFITLLQRSSPIEIREYLERKGKRKKIYPIILVEELPPVEKSTNVEDYKDAIVVNDETHTAKVSKRRNSK